MLRFISLGLILALAGCFPLAPATDNGIFLGNFLAHHKMHHADTPGGITSKGKR